MKIILFFEFIFNKNKTPNQAKQAYNQDGVDEEIKNQYISKELRKNKD